MITLAVPRTAFLALARLLRLPLAAMVALTALVAARLAAPELPGMVEVALGWGIFLLSAAASVLNQVLERSYDLLVPRTRRRPLACAQLAAGTGYRLGLVLGLCGALLLSAAGGFSATILGVGACFWYLLVYTPLKRLASLAVLAGTPCGAIPVLIGWLAGGGSLPAPQPLALALVLVLWQVPHYWLLALPERGALAAAGFRVLPAGLTDRRLLALCQRWLLGLALATLLLPLLGVVAGPAAGLVMLLAVALAVGGTLVLARPLFPVQAAARLRLAVSVYLVLLLMLLLLASGGGA